MQKTVSRRTERMLQEKKKERDDQLYIDQHILDKVKKSRKM